MTNSFVIAGCDGKRTKTGRIVEGHNMITLQFSNGERRTFGPWMRPAVVAAYCAKHNITAEIVAFTPS